MYKVPSFWGSFGKLRWSGVLSAAINSPAISGQRVTISAVAKPLLRKAGSEIFGSTEAIARGVLDLLLFLMFFFVFFSVMTNSQWDIPESPIEL